MKATEIKFTRRYNVAQYEHEEYSVTALLEEDDDAVEGLQKLKADVAAAYGGACSSGESEPDESDTDESSEEETGEEDTDVEDSETDSESDESEEEAEEEAPAPAAKAAKSAKAPKSTAGTKGGKKFKAKPQVYDRNNETHKELFSGVLKVVAPDWKKTADSKAKAKTVSQKMVGKEFLDANGEVVAAFKTEVKKLMGKK